MLLLDSLALHTHFIRTVGGEIRDVYRRLGFFAPSGLLTAELEISTIQSSERASAVWMDGTFEVGAIAEVVAAAAGNLVQTAYLLPASVTELGQGDGDGNGQSPSNRKKD